MTWIHSDTAVCNIVDEEVPWLSFDVFSLCAMLELTGNLGGEYQLFFGFYMCLDVLEVFTVDVSAWEVSGLKLMHVL